MRKVLIFSLRDILRPGMSYTKSCVQRTRNGKKLPWDTVGGGILFHGFSLLSGAVELASFEQLPFFKAIDKAFTKRELTKHLERGAVNAIKNYAFESGKSLGSESLEEGAQYILQAVYENILMTAANKDGADFDTHSVPEIAKEAVNQTVQAAKSMLLTSLVSGGIGQGVYTYQYRKISAEADKNFKKDKGSVSVPAELAPVKKSVLEELRSRETEKEVTSEDPEKLDSIRAVNAGDHLVPVNRKEERKLAEAHERGARAMNFVVEDIREMDVSDSETLVNQAALASGGRISESGDQIAYYSKEDIHLAVDVLAESIESVESAGNGYDVLIRSTEGELKKIQLRVAQEGEKLMDPDFAYADDIDSPHSLSRMAQNRAEEYAERQLVKDKLSTMIEHTGGRIAKTDLEANVDAVILVANTLNIPTDEMLEKNVLISFEEVVKDDQGNDTTARGSITQTSERQYTIHISKSADVSTLLHELGHTLRGLASQEQLADFKQHYGIDGLEAGFLDDIVLEGEKYKVGGREFDTEAEAKKYATAVEERFADDFVAYLMTGQAPTAELKNIFGRMKDVLTKLLREFKDRLTPEVRQSFDRLISGQTQHGNAIPGLPNSGPIPVDMDGNVLFQGPSFETVREKYIDTDQWMKAPNGKPTNLTENQWIAVRTPEFKKWFGDWEAVEQLKLLFSRGPVAAISGEEFKSNIVDEVEAFYDSIGKNVEREGLGKVTLTRHDIQSSIAHGLGRKKAAAFAAVPEVIREGFEFNRSENYKNRGYSSVTIAAPIAIGEEEYICEVVVNQRDSSNNFYLHEVELKEKLQFGNQVRNYMDFSPNRNTKTGASRLIISKLFSAGKFRASKVVDENGEPRVVFHGSKEKFSIFDFSKLGSNTGWPDTDIGFYFTSDRKLASGFGLTTEYSDVTEKRAGRQLIQDALELIHADGSYISRVYDQRGVSNGPVISGEEMRGRIESALADGTPFFAENTYNISTLLLDVFSKEADNYSKFSRRMDRLRKTSRTTSDNVYEVFLNIRNPSYSSRFEDLKADNDGVILNDFTYSGKTGTYTSDIYVVSDSATQIKSVNNRGTWDPNNPNILYQKAKKDVREGTLAVLHNITSENLENIDRIGGMPSPSIAITKPDIPFTQFGEITLIADPSVAEKAMEEARLYDRDIWSPTVPKAEWKISQKIIDAFDSKIRAVGDEIGTWIGGAETFSSSVIKDGLNSLVYAYSRNLGAQIAFLKESGIDYEVKYKRKDPEGSLPIEIIDENLEYFKSHEFTTDTYEEIVEYLKPKIEEYLNTAYAKYKKRNPAAFNSITENMREKYTSFGDIDRAFRFIKSYKKGDLVFDEYGTKDALSPIIKEHSPEFDLWLKDNLAPAYSDPKIKIGSKKYDYTAENILKWMRSQSQKASQSSMTYGPSKAASNAGTVLSDRQAVREKESILVTSDESKSAWDENIEPITEELQAKLPKYSDDDTWDALDSIYKSIGRYISKYGSEWNPSLMRKQFSNNGFKGVPAELIEKSLELVEALTSLPQDYFEAKPNRVVGLNEFVLAVVPKTLQNDKREILKKYGVEVIDYDGITDDRANVVRELFKGKVPNILFQGEGKDSKAKNTNLLFQLSAKARKEIADKRHDDVQQAVEEMFYVPTQILQEYAGEDWADRELELRRHLGRFPWILEEARNHSDEESFFTYLKEKTDLGDYQWAVEDELWYARIFAYSRIMTPADRDKQFVRMHTATDRDLIELGQMLKGYRDVGVKNNKTRKGYSEYVHYNWGSFKGVSTKVKTLSESSTKEELQEARKLIEANPRPYRKALNIVLEAEDRVLAMKAGDQYGHSQYARDNYFDTLGEEIEQELADAEGPNIGDMTDREVASLLRNTSDKSERYNARERLSTHSGVMALEREFESELKALGIENENTVNRIRKDLRSSREANLTLQKQLESARKDYRSANDAYKEELEKVSQLEKKIDREAGKASTKIRNLEKALNERRERVSDLSSQLTESNRRARELENRVNKYEEKEKNRKLLEDIERLHKHIMARVKFNPDTIDASYQKAMDAIRDLLDTKQRVGGYELLPDKLRAYLNDEALGYVQRGKNLRDWSMSELNKLLAAVELMRMDAKLILEDRKLHRSSILQSYSMQYYRQSYGEDANVRVGYGSVVPQILQELGEKRNRYKETWSKNLKDIVLGAIVHSQRLARLIDGDRQDGVMTNLLVRRVYEMMSGETANEIRRLEPAEKKMKELGLSDGNLNKDFFTYTTQAGDEIHLTLGQTIGLYVYSQNPISSEKLQHASGNGINFTQLADAIASLSDEQKAWGDYMIDVLGGDDVWERMQKVYYEVYNKNLGRRGRYFTFVADGAKDVGQTDILSGPRGDAVRYVDKGMTKEINIHAKYPLKLDVTSTFTTQVRRQEHFIHWASWVRDMNYLMDSGAIGKTIEMNYGPKMRDQVASFIKDVGSPQNILQDIEKLGNKILSNYSVAMLSLNALTMLKQLPSFSSVFREEVGMKDFLTAAMTLSNPGKHSETMEFIYSKAPLIKKRQISIEVAQYDNSNFSNPVWRGAKVFNDKVGMKGIQMMDHAVVSSLWLARYNTFIRKNQDTYQTQAQLEDEAAFQATKFIQETQPSSLGSDTSSVQKMRNPGARAFLLFSNQIFQYMNMALFDIPAAWRTKDIKRMIGILANLAISGGLIILSTGAFFRGDDEDDEEWLKRMLKEVAKMAVTYTVPFVGNAIARGIDGWSSGGGLIELPDKIGNTLGSVIDGDWDKIDDRVWDVVSEVGAGSGMPAVFVNRVVKSIREDNLWFMLNYTYGDLMEDRR